MQAHAGSPMQPAAAAMPGSHLLALARRARRRRHAERQRVRRGLLQLADEAALADAWEGGAVGAVWVAGSGAARTNGSVGAAQQRAARAPQAPGGPPSPRRRPAASRPAHTAWWLPADPAGAPTARWAAIGGGGRAPRCPRAVPGPSPLGPTTTSALGGRFGASLAAASASAGAGVLCSAPIVLRAPLAARCLRRSSCGLCVCGLPSLRANPGGFDNDAQQRAAVPRARYRAAAARVPAAPDSRDRVRRRHSSCRAWARSSWPACTPP